MKFCDNNCISQRHPILEEEVGGAPSREERERERGGEIAG